MDDLAAWLTQIWDEDEAQFPKACEAEAEYLRSDGMPDTTADEVREFWLKPETGTEWPFRLARIAADRQILAMHTGHHECPSIEDNCGWVTDDRCATVRLLASAYADRPGYQEAWREST